MSGVAKAGSSRKTSRKDTAKHAAHTPSPKKLVGWDDPFSYINEILCFDLTLSLRPLAHDTFSHYMNLIYIYKFTFDMLS